ncbi:ABC transporter substrate-binding protein [Vogesella sp. LIG4]|uniref:substrate-binding periplasmic protein n=1 Tax=Vogesella sp. LIG4 TaxID=1192162 RepID=UPI00081FCE83|nr:ABC transporter substrate-binding protein [Vogesella sp. LIG4]SCK11410.1 ABC-type amino acid transport substrate-binding protein [Vogesella sp. LIG4]
MPKLMITLSLVAVLSAGISQAEELRVGVAESDAPPIVVLDARHQLAPSLSYDLGRALATALGAGASFHLLSRNRVEPAVERSEVDIICNSNPAWFSNAARLSWTRDVYPQIERVVTSKTLPRQIAANMDMSGLRIGVIRGYHYPELDVLWQQGKATRVDHARLDSSLKALGMGGVDAVITSELELAGWARDNAAAAQRIKVQPWVVSTRQTYCAVAPKPRYSLAQVDRAIAALAHDGEIQRILQRYQWKPR